MGFYRIRLEGRAPGLLCHNGQMGLDTTHPYKQELGRLTSLPPKEKKRPAIIERTQYYECLTSMYEGPVTDGADSGPPTLPASMFRSVIEGSARKNKEGPLVRGGLFMHGRVDFEWDTAHGSTVKELAQASAVRHTVPVKVGQSRLLRTRALFMPWAATFWVDVDDELISADRLDAWLDLAGRRIGVGDWRPDKSGAYGTFTAEVTEVASLP